MQKMKEYLVRSLLYSPNKEERKTSMAVPILKEEKNYEANRRYLSAAKGRLAADLMPVESPGSAGSAKHVVLVMDGLKEFTMEPLEWVLDNIAIDAACTVTLLGVMPWLNIPLSSKTWSDIWTMDLEALSAVKEKSEWKSDAKYQKVQRLIELCQQYGVKPQVRSEMGFPLHLIVAEQIITLHATLVVFDRHHQKYREYYAERIPCNMVMMNEEGEVDMIRGKSFVDSVENTPAQSPASSLPSPTVTIAEHLRKLFKQRA
ncbi:hypothetical protein NMG60_11027547 [Bertholletia excelsa]